MKARCGLQFLLTIYFTLHLCSQSQEISDSNAEERYKRVFVALKKIGDASDRNVFNVTSIENNSESNASTNGSVSEKKAKIFMNWFLDPQTAKKFATNAVVNMTMDAFYDGLSPPHQERHVNGSGTSIDLEPVADSRLLSPDIFSKQSKLKKHNITHTPRHKKHTQDIMPRVHESPEKTTKKVVRVLQILKNNTNTESTNNSINEETTTEKTLTSVTEIEVSTTIDVTDGSSTPESLDFTSESTPFREEPSGAVTTYENMTTDLEHINVTSQTVAVVDGTSPSADAISNANVKEVKRKPVIGYSDSATTFYVVLGCFGLLLPIVGLVTLYVTKKLKEYTEHGPEDVRIQSHQFYEDI